MQRWMKEGFKFLKMWRCESVERPGEKNACKFCGKEFEHKYELEVHVDVDHDDMREKRCKYCDFSVRRVDDLRRHVKKLHLIKHLNSLKK